MAKRLAVFFGIVALLAACGDSGSSDSIDETANEDPPATDMPTEIVAALGTRVVVLSSEEGSEKRTLAEGETGVSSVAVTPDGATVYFTRADPNAACGEGAAFQVVSVPFEGGTPEVFASGSHAVVSPDGQRIAFATGGPNQCGPQGFLAVQQLGGDRFSQQLLEGGEATLVPLGWSADSRRVLYSVQTPDAVEAREAEPDSGAPPRTVALPDAGYLPAAVRNYLALLGWGTDDDTTLMSTDELVTRFDVARVGRASAIFDERKLRWVNGRHMRELPLDEYADAVTRHWSRSGIEVAPEAERLRAACEIVQDKAQTLDEVWSLVRFLFEPPVDDPKARAKFLTPEAAPLLREARDLLAACEPFEAAAIELELAGILERTGAKPKALYQAIRVAITGTTVSPGIFDSIAALGRDETLARIDAAL